MSPPGATTAGWTPQRWSDELARRVWCNGLGAWLAELGLWLGYSQGELPPTTPAYKRAFAGPQRGISLVLHYPFPERVTIADPDAWVIYQLDFDASMAPLPFKLKAWTEVPEGAAAKLSDDTSSFPETRTVTHYLLDNRVVALDFRQGYLGITAVHVTRLYGAVPFRP